MGSSYSFLETCANTLSLSQFNRTSDVVCRAVFLLLCVVSSWFLAFSSAPQPQRGWQWQQRLFGLLLLPLMMMMMRQRRRRRRRKRRETGSKKERRRKKKNAIMSIRSCSLKAGSSSRESDVIVCVNRPWFLLFFFLLLFLLISSPLLSPSSCHSLYLSNRQEFIELNESSHTRISLDSIPNALDKEAPT